MNRISAQQVSEAEIRNQNVKIIDVRKESEYEAEHVEKAYNKPLGLHQRVDAYIDSTEHFYLHCAGGYRSMMAAAFYRQEVTGILPKLKEDLMLLHKSISLKVISFVKVKPSNKN